MWSKPRATLAAACLLSCTAAFAEGVEGRPVPLFPELTWGMSRDAALAHGLQKDTDPAKTTSGIGRSSMKIGEIDFAAQADFGKSGIAEVPSGLNYMVLRHEGRIGKAAYEKFIRHVTKGFLYAGKTSDVGDASLFYNALAGNGHLIVRTTSVGKTLLLVAIGPGKSK